MANCCHPPASRSHLTRPSRGEGQSCGQNPPRTKVISAAAVVVLSPTWHDCVSTAGPQRSRGRLRGDRSHRRYAHPNTYLKKASESTSPLVEKRKARHASVSRASSRQQGTTTEPGVLLTNKNHQAITKSQQDQIASFAAHKTPKFLNLKRLPLHEFAIHCPTFVPEVSRAQQPR